MSNNNHRTPSPNNYTHNKYPERHRNDQDRKADSHHPAASHYYRQGPQPYPYPLPPHPSQLPNSKEQPELNSRQQAYNPQMHYNNYYYPQYPHPYPHYPPYQPQYYPQPPYPYMPGQPIPREKPDSEKRNYPPRQERRPNEDRNYNQSRQETSNPHSYAPRREEERQEKPRREEERQERPRREEERQERPRREEERQERPRREEERQERPRREQPKAERRREDDRAEREASDNSDYELVGAMSSSEDESEEEEVIYRRKAIAKKKDPILDSKQEIRKWIESRKRNYPKRSINAEEAQGKVEQSQLSILEKKIRKKIVLINSDPKSMMKKLKDIDILRRFILYSRKNRKPVPVTRQFARREDEPIREEMREEPIVPKEEAKVVELAVESKVENQPQLEELAEERTVEVPIKCEKPLPQPTQDQYQYQRREELSVDVIVKHLQMKQAEDTKTLSSLMDYKSNSFHFRYQHQTLETNLLLENIFNETSYILQAIRFIVKNNFFDEPIPTPASASTPAPNT